MTDKKLEFHADTLGMSAMEVFLELVRELKNGTGVRIRELLDHEIPDDQDGGQQIDKLDVQSIQEFKTNGQLHLISIAAIEGIGKIVNKLENELYTPHTDRCELFMMSYFKWADLLFVIVSVPILDIRRVEKLLESNEWEMRGEQQLMLVGTEDPKLNIHGVPAESFPLFGSTIAWLKAPAR